MLTSRAIEIFSSQAVIDVTHKNHGVWIESVNQQHNTAEVTDLTTNTVRQVAIKELQE